MIDSVTEYHTLTYTMMLRNIQEMLGCFLFCLLLGEVSYYFNRK